MISCVQVKLRQVSIRILIVADLVQGVLRQHLCFDFMRFQRRTEKGDQTVQDIDADLTLGHLLHLQVESPCIGTVHIDVFIFDVWHSASTRVHSNQLVKDVMVHDSFF